MTRRFRWFDAMRHRLARFVFVVLVVTIAVLAFLAVRIWSRPTSRPGLSVAYIKTIDGHGHWRLQFGITNIGNCTVFTSQRGEIEVFNHTRPFSVGTTSPLGKLLPRQGHVADAILTEAQMDSIDGKWRYSCLCAPDGLRSRIYSWQWGSNGPGARANWLIPQKFKGMPLTVKGTSDWIQTGKARSAR